ncbi:MAG: ribonuclease HII [Proteobacteria bacterium]|nr:ribonuclease HII [Pseudomonadota bacterium]
MLFQNIAEINLEDLKSQGFNYFCGIDEAGRGPLAGPVTAAAVCLHLDFVHSGINDSKKLSEKKRESLFQEIVRDAISYSIVSIGPRRIDQLNILNATKQAMRLCAARVTAKLKAKDPLARPFYFVDGNASLGNTLAHQTIIKGDAKVLSIAAASILAKVTRDRLMQLISDRYPNYKFLSHKGYPTEEHRNLILEFGPCAVHRKTFRGADIIR